MFRVLPDMPIYEYQCDECGHKLETLQRISEAPLTDCPQCNGAGLRKLVSAAAFRLKGTGWYETDFKNKGKEEKKPAKSNGDGADTKTADTSKSDGKSQSKSDSKPEGKSDSKSDSTPKSTGAAASASG